MTLQTLFTRLLLVRTIQWSLGIGRDMSLPFHPKYTPVIKHTIIKTYLLSKKLNHPFKRLFVGHMCRALEFQAYINHESNILREAVELR